MKIIISLPGCSFSNHFLLSWTDTIFTLFHKGYDVKICSEYSSFVPFARMLTLGLDVRRGPNQKPFNGAVDYDVWITIDSDIIFSPKDIIELIESTEIHPVVSGLYMTHDRQHYACVQDFDKAFFAKHGTYQFLTPNDVETYKKNTGNKFMKVAYNGMGFFACRRGAIECMKYPYFHRELQHIHDENNEIMSDMCSEDVAFCMNLADVGFDVYINCNLRVGHEKKFII